MVPMTQSCPGSAPLKDIMLLVGQLKMQHSAELYDIHVKYLGPHKICAHTVEKKTIPMSCRFIPYKGEHHGADHMFST